MKDSAQLVSRKGLVCCICARSVPLEASKTDEHGRAVHEECYVHSMQLRFTLVGPSLLPLGPGPLSIL
jgi:hypothetical protein